MLGLLHVLVTTTLLASLAADVGHGRAEVTSLLPVGASPETYQPAPADIVRVHQAGMIIENGAGLEAWLAPMLRSGTARAPVVNCSDGLHIVAANPHLWLDPEFARHYVTSMRDGMIAADPHQLVITPEELKKIVTGAVTDAIARYELARGRNAELARGSQSPRLVPNMTRLQDELGLGEIEFDAVDPAPVAVVDLSQEAKQFVYQDPTDAALSAWDDALKRLSSDLDPDDQPRED